jgi:hypothetical protein
VRRLGLLLASLLVAGLAYADDPAFRQVKRARRGSYYTVDGGRDHVDVKRTEAFLERLFALFGEPPDGWRIEYYRHPSAETLRQRVGFAAVGATDVARARIDSVRAYHPHELVHAVACRIGRTPPLFEEGLAEALTTDVSRRGEPVDTVARRFLAGGRQLQALVIDFAADDPERDYAVAGSFIAFLLDRHGIEPFVRLLGRCGRGERWDAALRAEYGAGLAVLEYEWSRELCKQPAARRALVDASSWPGSLRRAQLTPGPVAAQPARVGDTATPAADRAGLSAR